MKHLCTFADRLQLRAPGACVSRVYSVRPRLFTVCAFTRIVHVLWALRPLQFSALVRGLRAPGDPVMRQLSKRSVCTFMKTRARTSSRLVLLVAPRDPSPRCCGAVWTSEVTMRRGLMGVEASVWAVMNSRHLQNARKPVRLRDGKEERERECAALKLATRDLTCYKAEQ